MADNDIILEVIMIKTGYQRTADCKLGSVKRLSRGTTECFYCMQLPSEVDTIKDNIVMAEIY